MLSDSRARVSPLPAAPRIPRFSPCCSLSGRDAMGEGWFLKLRLTDPKELDALMDKAAYDAFVAEQE